jgi:hypothetical protein
MTQKVGLLMYEAEGGNDFEGIVSATCPCLSVNKQLLSYDTSEEVRSIGGFVTSR